MTFGLCLAGSVFCSVAFADDVSVEINGIDNPLKNNARKSLSVANKHKSPWSAQHIQTLYRLAPKEIAQALEPYGYYNPNIKSSLTAPTGDSKTWQATFKVDHGPATHITALHIAVQGPGDQISALKQAIKNTALKKGQRLVQSRYSDTKSAMYNAAYSAGYLNAKFSQSAIRVDPPTNTATIDLVLQTGPRFYFGQVTFKQDLLADSFVHRFVPFDPGEPYNAQQLIDMQLALSNSDYFNQIEISAERADAKRVGAVNQWFYDLIYPPEDPLESIGELQIPVVVTAKPSPGQSYKLSAGYGTDTGPRVGAGVKFPHLNRYGHQFDLEARVSQIQRSLQASYDIPIENVAKDKLSFTATINNEEFGDITSTLYGVGVVRDTGWAYGRQRFYLKYQREYYDLGYGNMHADLLFPGYNVTARRAKSLLFTRKGFSLSFDIHGGSDVLGSSTNFISSDLAGHLVLPITATTRLVTRAEVGAIGTDDFSKVPPSQRFFAGGAQSVRGYNYQSISPVNDDNKDIGGRYLTTASVEGDWFFYKKFGVAAFFDTGDAADSLSNLSFRQGVGIGFRYGSPVGMVRLDLAHPLNHSNDAVVVAFSLGPDL